jgi:hypothetical protein
VLYLIENFPSSPTKTLSSAGDVMDQCMDVGYEHYGVFLLMASNRDFRNSRIASSISPTAVAIPSRFMILFPLTFIMYFADPERWRYSSIAIITATGFWRFGVASGYSFGSRELGDIVVCS